MTRFTYSYDKNGYKLFILLLKSELASDYFSNFVKI